MTRRSLLKTLTAGVAASALAGCRAPLPRPSAAAPQTSPALPRHWVWMRINPSKPLSAYCERFLQLKELGITGILFEQDGQAHYEAAKTCGLQAWRWKWALNRWDPALCNRPSWFVVNRKGESCFDRPPYVDYYRFLCPSNPDLPAYLMEDYENEARKPYVDGIHLDYIRFPDVILPVGLWKNYGIEQLRQLPEYDYCYCSRCRGAFARETGKDPLTLRYPEESQSWQFFREEAVTRIVNAITGHVHSLGKPVTAAVFPGPGQARRMVRQNWARWDVDAVFPMLYNGFYEEDISWIGRMVDEGVHAFKGPLYAGLFCPDLPGENLERAIREALRSGAAGTAFFDGPSAGHLTRKLP